MHIYIYKYAHTYTYRQMKYGAGVLIWSESKSVLVPIASWFNHPIEPDSDCKEYMVNPHFSWVWQISLSPFFLNLHAKLPAPNSSQQLAEEHHARGRVLSEKSLGPRGRAHSPHRSLFGEALGCGRCTANGGPNGGTLDRWNGQWGECSMGIYWEFPWGFNGTYPVWMGFNEQEINGILHEICPATAAPI